MKQKDLRDILENIKQAGGMEITIDKSFIESLIEEVLQNRRRNVAQNRKRQAQKTMEQKNNEDFRSKKSSAYFTENRKVGVL